MSVLTVPATFDYASSVLNDVEIILFTNTVPAEADFAASQFDGFQIRDDVVLQGTAEANAIRVTGGTLDASAWQFSAWDPLLDQVTLQGTAGHNDLTGSSENDVIYGRRGRDRLDGGAGDDRIDGGRGHDRITASTGADAAFGGAGNDTFVIETASHADADSFHGEDGAADRIRSSVSYETLDLRNCEIVSVEILAFDNLGGTFILADNQIGGDGIAEVASGLTSGVLMVIGSDIDVSGVTFTERSATAETQVSLAGTAGDDVITAGAAESLLSAGDGADVLTGGSEDDEFEPGTGLDACYGNAGDDRFEYRFPDHLEAFEVIDGGEGTDRISVFELDADSVYDLRLALLADVEELNVQGTDLSNTTTTVHFTADYLGANFITHVTASSHAELKVDGPDIDVSMVTFLLIGPDARIDMFLDGDNDDNRITGSTLGDRIAGGAGKDILNGGGGGDTFHYAGLADSGNGGLTRDRIDDFEQGSDRLSFAPELGLVFVGSADFSATGTAEIGYRIENGDTFVAIDGNGDGTAESEIKLTGAFALSAADFVLV